MKRVLFTLLFIFTTAIASYAATNVSFQWDANNEVDLDGYRFYRSAISGIYDKDTSKVGEVAKADCCQFTENDVPDGTWFWVATAFDTAGNESGYSNEVTDTINTLPPAPPQNLNIWEKIIAWIKALFNWA